MDRFKDMGSVAALLGHSGPADVVKEHKARVIDTLDIQICRDDVDDIPVTVDILSVHHGTDGRHEDGARMPNNDDPDSVEFGDAYVTADMPPFRNGQSIELTHDELERAQEEYFNQ